MSYIILTIVFFLLAIFCYKKFNSEIMSPSVLTCLIFSLSFLGAFLGTREGSWNFVKELHFNTLIIILVGVVFFILGEICARNYKTDKVKEIKLSDSNNKYIRIDILKKALVFIFVITTFVLLYLNLRSLVGSGSISKIVKAYKSSNILYNKKALEEGMVLNPLILNMVRFCEMFCIVFIYIIVKNLINKDKVKYNISYLIIIIFIAYVTMLVGGRTVLLKYFMAGFIIWTILYTRKQKLSLNRFFKISIKLMIVFVPVCYFVLPLLGGKNSSTFVDYVTFYLGSQIPAFDVFLASPFERSTHFGEMTLKGIQMLLAKFGLINYWSAYQGEWVYFNRELYTNVFSEFKPFMQDFGIIGVVICMFIFGFVFSRLYLNAKNKSNCRYIIFFAFFSNLLIDQARIEVFYNSFLSSRMVIYFVSMLIITFFLFGRKKIRSGEI